MKEIEEFDKSAGLLEYEIEEDVVKLDIKIQTHFNFNRLRQVNDKLYVFGSCSSVEYATRSNEIRLFLKGTDDRKQKVAPLFIKKEHFEVFKDMLLEEGFELKNVLEEDVEVKEENERYFNFAEKEFEPTEEEINEMLDLVDLGTFTSIIKARMKDSGASGQQLGKINKTWAKRYLKSWAIAKYKFYKILGNKLKLEIDTEIEASNEMFQNAVSELAYKFPLYAPIIHSIGYNAFVNNKLNLARAWDSLKGEKRFTEGMNLTKFFALYNCKELDMEISKLYQDKNKAHLTISIDPNDYLTVSINKSWRSCHNFIDGEWRNAGLAYMNDKVSLVSYRSNGEVPYTFAGISFKWNSKSWRQMIYMSENSSTIIFSRQYPNESAQTTEKIRHLFEEQVSKFYGVDNCWKIFSNVSACGVSTDNVGVLYNDVSNGFGHKVAKNKADINFDKEELINLGVTPKKVNDLRVNIYDESEDIFVWNE